MFTPSDVIASERPHEIIALLGAPGSGKTTSCLTFPNPIFGDCDHKLPTGTMSVPFWNPSWVDASGIKSLTKVDKNHRDAIKKWVRDTLPKLSAEQTFIMDSWTSMMYFFNGQTRLEDSMLAKPNKYFEWKELMKYTEEMLMLFKTTSCRVVVTFHETPDRNEEGDLTGKLKPVMNGAWKDQILGTFTDVWRQVHDPIKRGPDGRSMRDPVSNGPAIERGWFWQLIGDHLVDCNMNPTLGELVRKLNISRIPADYSIIQSIYDGSYKA